MQGKNRFDLKLKNDSDLDSDSGLDSSFDLPVPEKQLARSEPRGEDWRSGAGRRSHARWMNTLLFPVISAVLVFHFQNCTPQGEGEAALGSDPAADSSRPVTVIDPVNLNTAVSFNRKQVELHSDVESVVLAGQCSSEQEGSVLGWSVLDEASGQEQDRGFSRCEGGEFKIELAPTQELVCDQTYKIRARLGLGEAGETELSRRCAPEAAAEVAAASMKPQLQEEEGALCQIERRHKSEGRDPSADLETSESGVVDGADATSTGIGASTGCSVVCYSAEGVVETERSLDVSNCGM